MLPPTRPSRRFLAFAFFLLIGILYAAFGTALALEGDARFASTAPVLSGMAAGAYVAVLLLVWGYLGLRERISLSKLWIWLTAAAVVFLVEAILAGRSSSEAAEIVPMRTGFALVAGAALLLGIAIAATWGTLLRRDRENEGSGFGRRRSRRSGY